MAFPSSPTTGDKYTTPAGVEYEYTADGVWQLKGAAVQEPNEYVYAVPTPTNGMGSGTDLPMSSTIGTIAESGGSFTLKAGKTYECNATLLAEGFSTSGYVRMAWVDASNTLVGNFNTRALLVHNTAGLIHTTQNTCIAVVSPTVDMTVKVRCIASSGTAFVATGDSFIRIVELK